MADFSKVTAWAVKNTARFDISIIKLSWIDEWLPGYFDYRAKLKIGKDVYAGRGIDVKEDIACDKALAEMLERAAVSNVPAPWATAAYPGYPGAAERAYRELVCIDRVLCHHFCKKRFKPVDITALNGGISPNRLKSVLSKHGLNLELCELQPVLDASVVAAFIWSERSHQVKGIVSGFGCEKKLADAASHALIECLRTAVVVFCGNLVPAPWELRCVPGNPRWHFWMAQKEEAKDFLINNLLPTSANQNIPWNTEKISFKDVSLTEVSSLATLIPDLPVRIIKASSATMLKPQFAVISMDEQFMQRLERFEGSRITPEKLIPHFYD